ncbi:MAG: hypothetical protein GY702_01175, partial [Desulfobulbaceae bacterium]|nr:hypothetical protein [Desulfobulbaceae bacterium]
MKMVQRPGQSMEEYKSSLLTCALRANPKDQDQRDKTLRKVAIMGISKNLQPLLKLFLADKPDANFNEIMNRMAFIGDSDPLEEDNPEETSLYPAGEAQKGGLREGGSQYYAPPMQGNSMRTNEATGCSGKWTEGIDENQFMSLLQSLNDSVKDMRLSNDRLSQTVKGLAGESKKKQAGEQTQTQALEKFGETVLKQMDQRLTSFTQPRGGYRGQAGRGRGRWKPHGGRGDGSNPSREPTSEGGMTDGLGPRPVSSRPVRPQGDLRMFKLVGTRGISCGIVHP